MSIYDLYDGAACSTVGDYMDPGFGTRSPDPDASAVGQGTTAESLSTNVLLFLSVNSKTCMIQPLAYG